jgi:hypothetical protein
MNRRVRTALALLTVGAALPFSPLTKLANAADDPAVVAIPKILDAKLTGNAALGALNAKGLLTKVAANANVSEAALTKTLQSDPAAVVTETGDLSWDDSKLPKPPTASPSAPGPVVARDLPEITMAPGSESANIKSDAAPQSAAAPVVAEADPASYHSRPGASKVIYLDFDGHSTTATSVWGAQTQPGFDLDGNPASYSSAEILAVRNIWERVSEDFAPFDVDVTTADPGFNAINRSANIDTVFGTRVVISTNGLSDNAIQGSFAEFVNHAAQQPVWIRHTSATAIKDVGESVSHFVGHSLGLLHDGAPGVGLHAGDTNWAPIMGNANTRPVSVWSKGEYPGATNLEDDIAIIGGIMGFVVDESTSRSLPQQLGLIDSLRSTRGIISGPGDADFIRFVSPTAGTIKVTATGATKPNLDIGIVLLDAVGSGIAADRPPSGSTSADIATGMDASITIDLPAPGVYYVYIYGDSTQVVGATGYPQYGSGGAYRVAVDTLETSGDSYAPVAQQRLLDTRGGPILAAGTSRNLTVAGVAGVPANATSVALNVAAVGPPTTAGHLRVYPAGPLPNASVVNFPLGKNTPNHVIVKVGTAGQIGIYASGTTHVIVDIAGYFFDDDSLSQFVAVNNPTQIFEGGLAGTTAMDIQVLGVGGMPNSFLPDGIVQVVAVNVGAKTTQAAGHLRVWTPGEPMPNSSTNNFVAGETRMNMVLVRPDANGRISVFNASSAPLTVTVYPVGVFRKSIGLGFKPTDPTRTLDTRAGVAPTVGPGNFVEAQIRGVGTVPNSTDVKAVVVNIVSTRALAAGYAAAGPSEFNDPILPTFYFRANENVANLAILKVGANGRIRIVNNSLAATDFIVDINGYLTD